MPGRCGCRTATRRRRACSANGAIGSTPPPRRWGSGLADARRPPDGALADWTREPDPPLVGQINDLAYGYDGSFERTLSACPLDAAHWYLARLDGSPAATLITVDDGTDAEVDLVATVPDDRGRGLAGALLGHALADARERGMQTSTLVATRPGRPVYERLGYRPLGRIEMWERRRGAPGDEPAVSRAPPAVPAR